MEMLWGKELAQATNPSGSERNLGSSDVFAPPGFQDFTVFDRQDVKVHERLFSSLS